MPSSRSREGRDGGISVGTVRRMKLKPSVREQRLCLVQPPSCLLLGTDGLARRPQSVLLRWTGQCLCGCVSLLLGATLLRRAVSVPHLPFLLLYPPSSVLLWGVGEVGWAGWCHPISWFARLDLSNPVALFYPQALEHGGSLLPPRTLALLDFCHIPLSCSLLASLDVSS